LFEFIVYEMYMFVHTLLSTTVLWASQGNIWWWRRGCAINGAGFSVRYKSRWNRNVQTCSGIPVFTNSVFHFV